MKAKDIVGGGESAVLIFTDGRNLKINEDGTGHSGNWRVKLDARADKVVVYFRNKLKNVNEIYLGDFVQLIASTEPHLPNRRAFKFTGMKYVGATDANWNQFTGASQGAITPVRYIR